jgi:hypothetical protein
MLLQLLAERQKRAARPAVSHKSLPPPVGGWNARDALPAMKDTDALRLDNFICDSGAITFRKGSIEHVTGLTGSYVESLMEYAPPTGANKLFAAAPNNVYDVTTTGAVGAASIGSMTNGRWQHVMFANGSGNYLFIVNGADAPRYFDGSSWTVPAITGFTEENSIHVNIHGNRIWLTEKDTMKVWYLATSAVAGAATELNLAPYARRGGYLVGMWSWSRDGGDGQDDYAVFITSKGEVIVYQGIDPASADTFALVGVWQIGEPIGRRCAIKAGSDLLLLTSQGVVPLSQISGLNIGEQVTVSITNKISGAFRDAYLIAGDYFGWQIIEYPRRHLVIVNVPFAERSTSYQYVINTMTGAWSRFTGINAGAWAMLGDSIFWGGHDGKVYQFDNGYEDAASAAIVGVYQSAYSMFKTPRRKFFKAARPIFFGPDGYVPGVVAQVNYDASTPDLITIASEEQGATWDDAEWDDADWGVDSVPSQGWQNLVGEGISGSFAFSVSSRSELAFNGVDVLFELGGLL